MDTERPLICVVGLGYIGLPTAAVLASRGQRVIGFDVNARVIDTVNKGLIHIEEPDLAAVVQVAVAKGLLRAVSTPQAADVFVIAVPTPFHDGEPDVSYVEKAAATIAPVLRKGNLVILESTSPVGTTERLAALLANARPDLSFPATAASVSDVAVAYCPERVLPGKVLQELVANDRIIGGLTAECTRKATAFYRLFCEGECLPTSARTAELSKLTENAFRDVNIAFANELSLICDRLGINVWELIRLANHHPRVNILQPGPGVGGHCIAVDPWFIVSSAPDQSRLIRTAREVNDAKPRVVISKIQEFATALRNDGVERPAVACLGLAFKPDIDDIRESPALAITEEVAGWGDCDVFVAEPHLSELPSSLAAKNHVVMSSASDAIAKSQIVALLVNHRQFYQIDRTSLRGKKLVDTRGMWA
ncbi:MAG: UDP-N-acetyl-D-mannosamine dehydrogenase [Variibacter sp.]